MGEDEEEEEEEDERVDYTRAKRTIYFLLMHGRCEQSGCFAMIASGGRWPRERKVEALPMHNPEEAQASQ